jgi:hypothetical protein
MMDSKVKRMKTLAGLLKEDRDNISPKEFDYMDDDQLDAAGIMGDKIGPDEERISEAPANPKLKVDVNHNPTKKGVKVQFTLPQAVEGDAKAQLTQKLQSKLTQGLSQYNLTVSQDTDVPYSNVIGFLIPIADFKLFIKNAIGGGGSGEANPPA